MAEPVPKQLTNTASRGKVWKRRERCSAVAAGVASAVAAADAAETVTVTGVAAAARTDAAGADAAAAAVGVDVAVAAAGAAPESAGAARRARHCRRRLPWRHVEVRRVTITHLSAAFRRTFAKLPPTSRN